MPVPLVVSHSRYSSLGVSSLATFHPPSAVGLGAPHRPARSRLRHASEPSEDDDAGSIAHSEASWLVGVGATRVREPSWETTEVESVMGGAGGGVGVAAGTSYSPEGHHSGFPNDASPEASWFSDR